MSCCQCQGIETHFDHQRVGNKLASYRTQGPDQTTRILIETLVAAGIDGMTLLDIGGGVGVIQHELLKSGVISACHVDASPASIAAAKEEAERQGHAHLMSFYQGDFVALAPELPSADIVTLDRVLCCYHDMPALVKLSTARVHKLYGIIYPRDTWWLKLGGTGLNLSYWLRQNSFRFFVHSSTAIDGLIQSSGLKRRYRRNLAIWQIAVYER